MEAFAWKDNEQQHQQTPSYHNFKAYPSAHEGPLSLLLAYLFSFYFLPSNPSKPQPPNSKLQTYTQSTTRLRTSFPQQCATNATPLPPPPLPLHHQTMLLWIHTPRAATALVTTPAATPAVAIKLTVAATHLTAVATKAMVTANEAAVAVVVAAVARLWCN